MAIRNSLWFLLLLLTSCGIFKTRIVTKTDSLYIDNTKIVTERIVDTIITLKSDTISYSFTQPLKDTIINLSTNGKGKVKIAYKKGVYSIVSIQGEKSIPIKIYEKKVEYRNVFIKQKGKSVVAKGNFNYTDFFIFLIISIIVLTLVLKSNAIKYAKELSSKIKLW
jgi:hypothetical protein